MSFRKVQLDGIFSAEHEGGVGCETKLTVIYDEGGAKAQGSPRIVSRFAR